MKWRLVGPYRAGWGTVAEGIADQPNTFYFGGAGGGIWMNIGLKGTQYIGRILVDLKNPDHVIVAALGHVFGNNAKHRFIANLSLICFNS